MKPLFVVFEGLDGSGTSTQAQLLANRLKSEGQVHLTSQPSSGPIGQMIRSALAGRVRFMADEGIFDRQMAYLFAADRHDHLFNDVDGILATLRKGYHVVCTRYIFSSFAYHCHSDDDFDFVRSLNSPFPAPDAVIYIDVPVGLAAERVAQRSYPDRYENARKLEIVRRAYERGLQSFSGPLLRVAGGDEPHAIHARIVNFVDIVAQARMSSATYPDEAGRAL